eukprot:PhM_4_TR2990/c0_g1_i1/m.14354/K12859/TXNL4A, DIB1; U5 snRNP protein, DIM1 family
MTSSSTKSNRELPRILTGYSVDLAINRKVENVIVIRFGREGTTDVTEMDSTLRKIKNKVRNFAEIYTVDIDQVTDFNEMYDLSDDLNVMFFYNNKHIQVDVGTGVNTRINFPIFDAQDMIDLVELVFRGGRKNKNKVESLRSFAEGGRF